MQKSYKSKVQITSTALSKIKSKGPRDTLENVRICLQPKHHGHKPHNDNYASFFNQKHCNEPKWSLNTIDYAKGNLGLQDSIDT